jgi:hypothetical protein
MKAKRKLENDKQMGERNLVGFTLLDSGMERQVRRYHTVQSVTNVNTGAHATLVIAFCSHYLGTVVICTEHNLVPTCTNGLDCEMWRSNIKKVIKGETFYFSFEGFKLEPTWKTERAVSSETFETIYQTTRHLVPKCHVTLHAGCVFLFSG